MPERRFPPPWTVEEADACFIVRDANRQALAYVYCEEEPGRRSAAKLLTRDEARRIAVNIAKLPDTRNYQRPSLARRGASYGRLMAAYALIGHARAPLPAALDRRGNPKPASSSATPTGRRLPTSISRRSRDGARRRTSSPATRPAASPSTSRRRCCGRSDTGYWYFRRLNAATSLLDSLNHSPFARWLAKRLCQ